MWRDLFSRSPQPSAALSSALADLDRLARSRPELESPARSLAPVLAAAFATPPILGRPYDFGVESPQFDDVLRAWGSGGSAFRKCPPTFDPADLRGRISSIVKALKPANPSASTLLRASIDWRDLASRAALGDESEVEKQAIACLVSIDLLASMLRLAILPVLAECSAQLASHRPEVMEENRVCPNCGRPPSLAESRVLEGRRHLRCGVCASDWPALRMACASCGEASAKAVRSLFVEGEESRHRLVVCDSCGFRLKVVSTLTPISAPGLLVAELATVHLDFVT